MIRNIVVRVSLLLLLAGIGYGLWLWPLVTIAIFYPLSWLLTWDQITAPHGYESRIQRTFDAQDNSIATKRIEKVYRPSLGDVIWGLIVAPFRVLLPFVMIVILGDVPIL